MSDKWRNQPTGDFINPDSVNGKAGEISVETYELISNIIPFISSPQELIALKKGEIDAAINVVKTIIRAVNITAVKCAVVMKDMEMGVIEDAGISYSKDEETGNCSASQYFGHFPKLIGTTDPRQINLILGLVQDAFAAKGYYIPNYPASISKEDAYGVFEITCETENAVISIGSRFRVYIMLKNKA